MPRHLNLGLKAESGFVEFNGQIIAQIITTLAASTASSATGASEDITEDIAKDVLERTPPTAEATAGETAATAEPGMAELIVGGPFLAIREDRVSFGKLLETLFGLFIPRIFVGMELDGETPVRLFDFGITGVAVDLKNLVIITLCQQKPPP